MKDLYRDLINEQWGNIAMMYDSFKDKKPIIEYNIADNKIYSFPAEDYINGLTHRKRNMAKTQYEDACSNNQFMLFVRDEKNEKLISYIFEILE